MRTLWVGTMLLASAMAVQAQRVTFHGVPSSVTSPTPDGRTHSIPSSVTSPVIEPRGFHSSSVHRNPFRGPFGTNVPDPFEKNFDGRFHRGRHVPYLPIYSYPLVYGEYYQPDTMEEPQPQPQPQPVQREVIHEIIREVPVDRNALDRGGRYETNDRPTEPAIEAAAPDTKPAAKAENAKPEADDLPITELVFKDGRHVELKNYAIVGKNIFDLNGGNVRVMKKYAIAELDIPATKKINEDRGVDIHLP